LGVESGLVKTQGGRDVTAEAVERPAMAQGLLEFGKLLADVLDEVVRRVFAPEIDGRLPAGVAVSETKIGAVGSRAASPPRGHDAPLSGEDVGASREDRQRGMGLLVNNILAFQFAPRGGNGE
jgi:hypothetical protein